MLECMFLINVVGNGETVDFIDVSLRGYLRRSYGQWWNTEKVHYEPEEALSRATKASSVQNLIH